MAVSTISTNPAGLHSYYERKLLSVLEPRLVLQPLGKQQRMPKGLGDTIRWLRYSPMSGSNSSPDFSDTAAINELSEGTPPSEVGFTTTQITSQIKQYGQFTKVSDRLTDLAIDPVLKNLAIRFGFNGAKTIESLIVAEVESQAAVQRVNNAANDAAITSADVLDHIELIEATITQKADFIGPHESGDYVAVVHPFAEFDLKSDQNAGAWLDINKRTMPSQQKLMNGEFGRMYGMRLLVSDKMTLDEDAGSGTTDVVSNYVIGEEAYATVKLDGRSVQLIVKKHGSAGANDPLDQFATVGYKINGYATKYLDSGSKRVVNIRSASAIAD